MMWIGCMGALVTKLPGVVNGFVGVVRDKAGALNARPAGADAPVSRRVSAFQDLAIRPKPGSQPNVAR